jgi:hypothetical protein
VAIGGVLSEAQVAAVRGLEFPGIYLERRPVREYPGGDLIASLIGKVGFDNTGLMGAELALDTLLEASNGRARYVRDASGRPLWIERGQWTPTGTRSGWHSTWSCNASPTKNSSGAWRMPRPRGGGW